MKAMRGVVPLAVLALAACGGGGEETEGGAGAGADSVTTGVQTMPMDTTALPPGTVDTAGMGTNPPTAGGQLVDTAAVPGTPDTTQGTPTAP